MNNNLCIMYFQVLKMLKSFQLYIQVDKIQAFLNVHTDRPTDWLTCQFINQLTKRLTGQPIHLPVYQLTHLTTDLQIYQPTDQPTYQFIDWLTDLPLYQPNDCPTRSFLNTQQMSDWLTRQFINRLNWPIDWLTDQLGHF